MDERGLGTTTCHGHMPKKDKDDTVLTIHFTEEGTLSKAIVSNKMEHLGYQR